MDSVDILLRVQRRGPSWLRWPDLTREMRRVWGKEVQRAAREEAGKQIVISGTKQKLPGDKTSGQLQAKQVTFRSISSARSSRKPMSLGRVAPAAVEEKPFVAFSELRSGLRLHSDWPSCLSSDLHSEWSSG